MKATKAEKMTAADMSARLYRISVARARMQRRIDAGDPKKDLLEVRLAEYDQTVANLKKYGFENIPTGNPVGVLVGG